MIGNSDRKRGLPLKVQRIRPLRSIAQLDASGGREGNKNGRLADPIQTEGRTDLLVVVQLATCVSATAAITPCPTASRLVLSSKAIQPDCSPCAVHSVTNHLIVSTHMRAIYANAVDGWSINYVVCLCYVCMSLPDPASHRAKHSSPAS